MNYVIELERFLFAIMICIMHFGYYNNFYIGVDFFFMVTGFFIAAKTICSKTKDNINVWGGLSIR